MKIKAMNIQGHRTEWLLIVSVLFMSSSTLMYAVARNASGHHRYSHKRSPLHYASHPAKQENRASRIAHERYQFLKRISASYGYLPLVDYSGDTTSEDVVIFPAGRADRLYLFFRDFENTDQCKILCYQRKNGKDKVVYDISLVTGPPTKIRQPQSLFDYMRSSGVSETPDGVEQGHSYILPARISQYAKNDLTFKRAYVEYHCLQLDPYLSVSSLRNDHVMDSTPIETYTLYLDPFTNAYLKDDEFYQRYGLPVATEELFNIKSHQRHFPQTTHPVQYAHPNQQGSAKSLAFERYLFVARMISESLLPLDGPGYSYDMLLFPTKGATPMFQTSCTALFPRQRSDRLYLFYWNNNDYQSNVVFCYQRTNDKYRLIYKIHLKTVSGQVQKLTRINSLQDYLRSCEMRTTVNGITREVHYAIIGKVSPTIKRDLNMAGAYVQYSYDESTNSLEAWLLSNSRTGHPSSVERFYLGKNPIMYGNQEQKLFFYRYGFPTAKGE